MLRKYCKKEIGFFLLISLGMIIWTFTIVFTLTAAERGKVVQSTVWEREYTLEGVFK